MLPTIFRELSSLGAEVYWAEWDIYIAGRLMASKAYPTPYITSPVTNEVFSEPFNVLTSIFFCLVSLFLYCTKDTWYSLVLAITLFCA